MTTTSIRPISIDGVRLDTLAWNITRVSRATAHRRSADVELAGVDGLVPTLNDPLGAAQYGLDMFVRGTDADGAVPPAGSLDTFRANLDELLHLFGKRHALLEVTEQVSATASRRALAKVTDAIAPDVQPGALGQFTVAMVIPSGVWEDTATTDWAGTAGAASGTVQTVTTLDGATERITDAIVLVEGPVTNPRVTDQASGAYVQLNQALAAGQFWRVNVGTWASRYGAGLGLGSADTTGTDGQAFTAYGGTRNVAHFLPLVPVRANGTRRVSIALTGTGITAATRVTIRARRKYAA